MISENQVWKSKGLFTRVRFIILGVHHETGTLSYQEVHKTAEEGRLLPVLHARQEHFLVRHVLGGLTIVERIVQFLTRIFRRGY